MIFFCRQQDGTASLSFGHSRKVVAAFDLAENEAKERMDACGVTSWEMLDFDPDAAAEALWKRVFGDTRTSIEQQLSLLAEGWKLAGRRRRRERARIAETYIRLSAYLRVGSGLQAIWR